MTRRPAFLWIMSIALTLSPIARAEDGYAAWLRYRPLPKPVAATIRLPWRIVALDDAPTVASAYEELRAGIEALLGTPVIAAGNLKQSAILLGTVADLQKAGIDLPQAKRLREDGFLIAPHGGHLVIAAINPRGVLYGAFALLRRIDTGEVPKDWNLLENPSAPIRYLNHWDNPGGTIERGYAGRSIFFSDDPEKEGLVTTDLARVADYARLLASVGINGCSLNNVNADDRVYGPAGLAQIKKLADAMRPYGVQTMLSISLDSPKRMGDLSTFDPLDPAVAKWWKDKVDQIYTYVPDFAGFVLKADSEGRLGPSAYGRTHADAANVIARALKPHGGVIFYRGFVYDHHMDWRNLKNDRARAAYDNFKPLDGRFDDNAVVQIKNGPIDFQVREPASPAFAGLEKTNVAMEFQITQEYLGQQRHTVYEAPMWKDVLGFDFGIPGHPSRVEDVVTGKAYHPARYGFVAVSGVGRDRNWLGNHLAQANLYAYGRLTWNPELSAEAIADEWTQQTFSREPKVRREIGHILMRSWPAYEDYTGNLGIGGLTDIIEIHYGPSPISSEHNGWGQWHRSNETGTGMDRTAGTGTGFTAQYPPKTAALFENLATCPEDLLLFFHHVPYTYRLKSGETVIQHVYDAHYRGAAEVDDFIARWKSLHGLIDDQRYQDVLGQLEYQAGHALVWRDSICQWFAKLSGIPDAKGRVFHEPNRVEAESMSRDGYEAVDVEPWEAASGGKAVRLSGDRGSVSLAFGKTAGRYDLTTWYFDVRGGAATFSLQVNGKEIDRWVADRDLPTDKLDAHSRTRHITPDVELNPGDEIRIVGTRDRADAAGLDFLEIAPSHP